MTPSPITNDKPIIPTSKQMDIWSGIMALLGNLWFWWMNFLCWALFWQGIVYFWGDCCRCQPMKNKPCPLVNHHHWMGRWRQWWLLHLLCEVWFRLPWMVIYGWLSMQMWTVQGAWAWGVPMRLRGHGVWMQVWRAWMMQPMMWVGIDGPGGTVDGARGEVNDTHMFWGAGDMIHQWGLHLLWVCHLAIHPSIWKGRVAVYVHAWVSIPPAHV